MMYDAIQNFSKQFEYEPVVENADFLPRATTFVVVGMGGSHLAADLIRAWKPDANIVVHRDYGLPSIARSEERDVLVVISSYSGNTEEVLDALHVARAEDFPVAVIAKGGKLLEEAYANTFPYVKLPDMDLQPRLAIGLSMLGLLALMGDTEGVREVQRLAASLRPNDWEEKGKQYAEMLYGRIPLIYASTRNTALAYIWKITLNETGKIPAFYNVFPELNHNEMTGFDIAASTHELSKLFACVMLKDETDDVRIIRRIKITERLYHDRAIPAHTIVFPGESRIYSLFSLIVLIEWVAYYIATRYDRDPEEVPMIEEFKRNIADNRS
ncbi:MAG: hypothetical protein KGI50_01820 [Patescibacteria group bacterium]|nr:hypothetical protein [Patescibacteria group bacterium]MDE2437918.1 hypothetical protein [Patescibacteria group bacterium]